MFPRNPSRAGRTIPACVRAPWERGSSDLIDTIQAHSSGSTRAGNASEANAVVDRFNALSESQKQDLLNFLRSL
jgi:hypothetical protein